MCVFVLDFCVPAVSLVEESFHGAHHKGPVIGGYVHLRSGWLIAVQPCRPALVFVQNARQGSPHVVISNFVTAVQEFVTGQGHTRELAKT